MEPTDHPPANDVYMEEVDQAVTLGAVHGDLFDDAEFIEAFGDAYMEELAKSPLDNSVMRRMYYDTEVRSTQHCPRCEEQLFPAPNRYLVGTQDDNAEYTLHILGPMGGAYCLACPTVVLNTEVFYDYADEVGHSVTEAITVMGVINRETIPLKKRGAAFNDDNPLPLVKFEHIEPEAAQEPPLPGTGRRHRSATKPKPKPRTKRPKPQRPKKKKKKK